MKTIKVIINFLFTFSLLNFLWGFSFKTAAIFNGETGINLSLKDSYSLLALTVYLLVMAVGLAFRFIEVKRIHSLVLHALLFVSMAVTFSLLSWLHGINSQTDAALTFINFIIWFTYFSFEQFSSDEK